MKGIQEDFTRLLHGANEAFAKLFEDKAFYDTVMQTLAEKAHIKI